MYISIASYRDPLLQSTIDDAFKKAANPDDLSVGCFIQTLASDPTQEKQLIRNDYDGRVQYSVVPAGQIFSVTQCRNLANQWLKPEHEYVLQVDSHTRFEENWDLVLKDSYLSLSNEKAILSSYLPAWIVDEDGTERLTERRWQSYAEPTFNTDDAKKSFFTYYELVPTIQAKPKGVFETVPGWYLCGHFIFSSYEYFSSLKQPEWILFWGEEVYNSLRAYTHGWDVYFPEKLPARHLFPQDVPHMKLNKLWVDFSDQWRALHDKSTDLVIDAILSQEVGDGHLGTKRSLAELYSFIGYDLGELIHEWREEYRRQHSIR